jgi:hypothetical protein
MRQSPRLPAGFFWRMHGNPAGNDKQWRNQMNDLLAMKARQSDKIRQLAEVAKAEGLLTLDGLADAFGIPRSTAATIRKGQHKASGLSASIVNRMLTAPNLPSSVHTVLRQYIAEKTDGLYGWSSRQRACIEKSK